VIVIVIVIYSVIVIVIVRASATFAIVSCKPEVMERCHFYFSP